MKYRVFGNSGLRVSELCLGTMTFGTDWGWGADWDESKAMFETFAAAGGNFIDTANRYTNGTSEKYVGELIGRDRDRFVLATKYTLNLVGDDPNSGGSHRKALMASIHASLRRLGTDYIDVLWVHCHDPLTPIHEIMRGLDDVVRMGKVHYVAISDAPAWWVARAHTLAELRGWTPFCGLQINYSLIERSADRDLLPMAQHLDLAVTPWAVLGGGMLTGKYRRQRPEGARFSSGSWGDAFLTERNHQIADVVAEVAQQLGWSASQTALRWAMQRPGNVMIPLVGARHRGQLEDNLRAAELELPPEHQARLDEASAIDLGFPHAFLKNGSDFVFGELRERIVDHHDRFVPGSHR